MRRKAWENGFSFLWEGSHRFEIYECDDDHVSVRIQEIVLLPDGLVGIFDEEDV